MSSRKSTDLDIPGVGGDGTSKLNIMFNGYKAKHNTLPLWLGKEIDFYRCIPFNSTLYGKTVSELHQGNLRVPQVGARHSKLFSPNKVSYWSSKYDTAYAEIKKHGAGSDIIAFWAYDDATSTFPTMSDLSPLVIVDGVALGFHTVLRKLEEGIELTPEDLDLLARIEEENPDCLAYESVVIKGTVNFMFFEKGFRKLSLRQVRLRVGTSAKRIHCAGGSDYIPDIESYGNYFEPKARVKYDKSYESTEEYLYRLKHYKESGDRFREYFDKDKNE
jgi:hypothetical protein